MNQKSEEIISYTHIIESYYEGALDFTINKLRQLHAVSMDLEMNEEVRDQEPILQGFKKISEKIIPFIKNNKIVWNEQVTAIFEPVFSALSNLKSQTYLEWGVFDFFYTQFPHENFIKLLKVGLGLPMHIESYNFGLCFYSKLLNFFENVYFHKVLVTKPRIESEQIKLYDPFHRELIRDLNLHDVDINRVFFTSKFSIKMFVLKGLDTFFHVDKGVDWNLADKTAHYKTLKMVLTLFEYGLWTVSELQGLCSKMQYCSNRLFGMENFMKSSARKSKNWIELSKLVIKSRIVIARILIHIISFHYDYEIKISQHSLGLKRSHHMINEPKNHHSVQINPHSIFAPNRFKKSKLHTFLTYILSGYLITPLKEFEVPNTEILSARLSTSVTQIMGYISDIKQDFFMSSLRSIDSASVSFYILPARNSYRFLANEFYNKVFRLGKWLIEHKNEEYRNPNHNFYFEFEKLMMDLIDRLKFDCPDLEVFKAYQLALTQSRIPQVLLSILNLMAGNEEFCLEKTEQLIGICFEVISLICKDNAQCSNSFFCRYVWRNFIKLYQIMPVNGAFLLMQLLAGKGCTKIIFSNVKLMEFVYSNFEHEIDKFVQVIENNNSPGPENIDKIYRIMIYCYILKIISKENNFYDARINLKIAQILSSKVKSIIQKCLNDEQSIDPNIDEKFNTLRTLEGFIQESSRLIKSGQANISYFILMVCERILSVFAQATARFCLEGDFKKFKETVDFTYVQTNGKNHINSDLGKKVWRSLLRLYRIFEVYPENILLTTANKEHFIKTYFGEDKKADRIFNDLTSLFPELIELLTNAPISRTLMHFVLKSYLPGIFKFVCGLLTSFTDEVIEMAGSTIEQQVNKMMQTVDDMASEIHSVFIINYRSKVNPFNEPFVEEFFRIIKEERGIIERLNEFKKKPIEFSIKGLSALAKMGEIYKTKPMFFASVYRYFKFSSTKHQKELNVLMKAALSSHSKYRIEYGHDEDLKKGRECPTFQDKFVIEDLNKKKAEYELLSKNNFCLLEVLENDARFSGTYSSIHNKGTSTDHNKRLINMYGVRYYELRMNYIDNKDQNQMFKIFKLNDSIYNFADTFVHYFHTKMVKLSQLHSEEDSLVAEILLNPSFRTLLILTDNLLRIHSNYREKYYELCKDKQKGVMFKCIWYARNTLFGLLTSRMFIDEFWSNLYIGFYLVSSTIQNFCENNFCEFKRLICEVPENKEPSLLKVYHDSIESVVANSDIYLKKKDTIDLRDKPELFPVLTRALEEMSEFISGGRIDPLEIYKYRIDVWLGILFRIEGNIESEFYQVKKNVIMYISSQVESKNSEIVEFFVNKLFARSAFKLCTVLLRMLYRSFTKDCSKKNFRMSFHRLKHLYKGNKPDPKNNRVGFADHIIIEILVALFGLITSLSENDLRYEQFMTNMENLLEKHSSEEEPNVPDNDLCDAIVTFKFLKSIVVEIELNVEMKDKNDEVSKKLITYTFKKEPICFFDQKEFQNDFFASAPIGALGGKHEQFFDHCEYAITRLKGEQQNYNRSQFLSAISTDFAFKIYLIFLYLILVAINILCIIFFNRQTNDFNSEKLGDARGVILGLTLAEAGFALLFMALWFTYKYPIVLKLKKLKMREELGGKSKFSLWDKVNYNLIQGVFLEKTWYCLFSHVLFPLLGLATLIFYCLLLFLIIDFSKVLKGVCLSIFKNLNRLFWTLVIIIIVINFFALLLTEWFNPEMSKDYLKACGSYFSCFINNIKIAIVHDGGITSAMESIADTGHRDYGSRFAFNLIYFILVNIFLLGMFFGIIVDAFSEYMKDLNEREEDQSKLCYTCGLSKPVLERLGEDFDKHVEDHYVFLYMYYIIYLRNLDVNSYSGVDVQVYKMLKGSNKSEFLPKYQTINLINKGLKLTDAEKGDSEKKE